MEENNYLDELKNAVDEGKKELNYRTENYYKMLDVNYVRGMVEKINKRHEEESPSLMSFQEL